MKRRLQIEEDEIIHSVLEWFPEDIWKAILSHVTSLEYSVLFCTSQKFQQLISKEKYTKVLKKETMQKCAIYDNINLLQWAVDNGCYWNSDINVKVAANDHPNVLRWIAINKYSRSKNTPISIGYENAITKGQIQFLQWARSFGCPWDDNVCKLAAQHGQLETLQWAIANGCQWNIKECIFLASKHPKIVQWISKLFWS